MENSDYFFVTGEIGVAFAGFAALVTVLAQKRENYTTRQMDLIRLRFILIGSVLAVLLSLLPFVVSRVLSESEAWRFSALAAMIGIGYLLVNEMVLPAIKAVRDRAASNLSLPIVFLNMLFLFSSVMALTVCLIGFPSLIANAYVVSIYAVLLVVATSLVRFFISLASA